MRRHIKKWFWSLILLAGVIITSLWLYRVSQTSAANAPALPHYPDAFMTDITVTQYDQNGQVSMNVMSPYAQHFQNDIVNFWEPKITIINKTGSPWVIMSDYGQSQQKTKMLYFWYNVVIGRAATPNNQGMSIYTPAVAYNTSTRVATSDQDVKLIQPPANEVDAVGFNAYLEDNYVELLGNVVGYYVPSRTGTSPLKP